MDIDARTAYWTGAWLNMLAVVLLAGSGIRRIRAGEVARHRRRMLAAVGLVGLFLVSYVFKLVVLGREALETWSANHVWGLRVHELCILVMGVAGATALYLAARHRFVTQAQSAPQQVRRAHRRAGWTAALAAALGIATAGYVLFGMYQRAGVL